MRVQFITTCIAAMVVCICGVAFGADEIIYSQNFDELDDGDMDGQDGWAVAMGQASTTVQSDVALNGKAMRFDANQEVSKTWAKSVESGTCYLSIFFRKEDANADNTLHIYMGKGALAWSAGPVLRIGAQSGDPEYIGVHDGGDNVIERPSKFEVGKWHHIREVIDVDKMSFDLYLDGKKLGNYDFRNASHDAIEWLMIGFDGGVGTLGYYDAIEFGLGKGEQAYMREMPVEPAGKLSIIWGNVKIGH